MSCHQCLLTMPCHHRVQRDLAAALKIRICADSECDFLHTRTIKGRANDNAAILGTSALGFSKLRRRCDRSAKLPRSNKAQRPPPLSARESIIQRSAKVVPTIRSLQNQEILIANSSDTLSATISCAGVETKPAAHHGHCNSALHPAAVSLSAANRTMHQRRTNAPSGSCLAVKQGSRETCPNR